MFKNSTVQQLQRNLELNTCSLTAIDANLWNPLTTSMQENMQPLAVQIITKDILLQLH